MINKRVIVTGSEGFLGSHLMPLLAHEYSQVIGIRHEAYDLLCEDRVKAMYHNLEPDIVIHLAARVGGIQYNQKNPAKLFYENLQMGMHMIHQGYRYGKLEKFTCLGSVCQYPCRPEHFPFIEDDIYGNYPESTNAPYGYSKRSLEVMCRAYREQYGMNNIFLLPCNLFGEFDTFTENEAHVIPMLIKRFIHAKENGLESCVVWGTGEATREFLYAGDCAKLIVEATKSYNESYPMNLGSGKETSIAELAELISELVGYKGKIVWDDTKPDGQPRRFLDISRSIQWLGFKPEKALPLEEGLKRTIEWYLKNRSKL
jgi:GDP-L-fucose synthase